MTKDQIFTDIQNIVSDNPVLVIGSGASVPYNIPGMDTLADKLREFFSSKHTQIQIQRKPYMSLSRT